MKAAVGCLAMLCAVFVCVSASAQDPTGVRTSLVINEVMPDTRGNQCPWIEVYNPTGEDRELSEFLIRLDGLDPVPVETSSNRLNPDGRFVVCVQAGACDGCNQVSTEGETRVVLGDRPSMERFHEAGEVLLLHRLRIAGEVEDTPVDYIAWGEQGQPWSEKSRRELWPLERFVRLDDHFGHQRPGEYPPVGFSIGLYPGSDAGTPADWVVFDALEASKGGENPVPSPKVFSLRNHAIVGSQSVAFSWQRARGDNAYNLKVFYEEEPTVAIIDRDLSIPIVRIVDKLAKGVYRAEVVAYGNGAHSAASKSLYFSVAPTSCDWPLPVVFASGFVLPELFVWTFDPVCNSNPVCNRIRSMRFKFQRKDTFLRCTSGCSDDPGSPCNSRAPQSRCVSIVETGSGTAPFLCSGPALLSTCWGPYYAKLVSGGAPVPLFNFGIGAGPLVWGTNEHDCAHADNYCAMASVSMMASAYGKCLSQDQIAYRMCQREGEHECGSLRHSLSSSEKTAEEALKSALWIPDDLMAYDPPVGTAGFSAARFKPQSPAVIDFDTVKRWIKEGRPIMALGGWHYSVVAGYCRDEGNEICEDWVFEFDPGTGPRSRCFDAWKTELATFGGSGGDQAIWVGPPVGAWGDVETDDVTVWNDADHDDWKDLDESRFDTDPNDEDEVPP